MYYNNDKSLNILSDKNKQQDNWTWNDSWNTPNGPNVPNTPPSNTQPMLPNGPAPAPNPEASPKEMVVASSYEDALKKSGELGRPVLLFFEAQSCSWCQKMKSESLADTNVRNLMKNYIFCDIDCGINRDVATKYSVSSVPSFVITNSTGASLKSGRNYMSVQQFSAWLNNPSLYNQPKSQPPQVQPQNPKPEEQPKTPRKRPRSNPNCPNCPNF